ncbi:sigma-70 family RNA polymerase sigma factor [Tenggerimyces flavus]|uniref:RNA polymerase sigma factor n=1 Tax=Tenggerimyces flavus TaxID=1708749 RepID=A0ABV7YF85_9ACTN|nr:sigma-70 family RNA polymerase sigma factor [Tenggerimyces flavus]MBM7787880.1 RNA polymerase sigma-70 factor (ECF subfamily) [Tenggerimyces flavus]
MSTTEQLPDLRDESAFTALVERHRGELQVHCYRMLGSLEDAEDLVQETFLRAWRSRESFGGSYSFRAWLYRIATNACLDVLRSRSRRVLPPDVGPAADPAAALAPPADLPWLQPYPDALLDQVAAPEDEPAAVVVSRETIELTFIAAIQHLPPRQRAVLILRDVLGWTAKDTAELLEGTVTSANSALQRARATLRQRLGERRTDWRTESSPSAEERELLRRYIEAHERSDLDALAALLREDAWLAMPPHPTWFAGRAAILVAASASFDSSFGTLRSIPAWANRQPGVAHYLRAPGSTEWVGLAIDVLRIEDGLVAEITSFDGAEYFAAFGLESVLDR